MRTLGNIIWLLPFFGWVTAGLTWLIGLLLTITVVGAPLGLGLMEHGKFLLWPFGNVMINKKRIDKEENSLLGVYKIIIMIIYLPFGLMLWIMGLIQTVALFFTIIGIPVALVMAKSLSTFFNPINKIKVSAVMLQEIERRESSAILDNKQ